MNTYSKILITTLPLFFALFLSTVGVAYYFSRLALTELAEIWLDARLSEAMEVVVDQDQMLRRYGLENIPASIAKAKIDACTTLSAIKVGQQGGIFAIDSRGFVAAHPDVALVGRDVSREPWFEAIEPGRNRLIHTTTAGENLAMVDYFQPWGWYVLASDPRVEIYGIANRMTPYLIGLGLIGFVSMAGVLMLLTRWLTEPLRLLTAGAERIGRGDLDAHISIGSRDEFGRLAAVFNQMTQQLKETLTRLRHREARFRSLIENAADLIVILKDDGRIAYLSPSIERILGYPSKQLIGRRAFDFIHPDDRDHSLEVFERRIRAVVPEKPTETRLQHKDGSWRTLEATSENLLDHPAVAGLVVNARDITQRKAAEAELQRSYQQLEERVATRTAELFDANAQLLQEIEARKRMNREKDRLQDQLIQAQKMKAIGTLAGGIAHDFNNLLMGIQGNLDLLSLDIDPARDQPETLKTIQECVLSGTRLTQQLLGFARMGKYEVKAVNLNQLIAKSADMFGRTRQELRLVASYQENVWTVNADPGQIEQVLLNLLINGWQAMPEGGTIFLETANQRLDDRQAERHQAGAGKYVRISVCDTGIGMDPATMQRIFDPFFTTKTMKRGTGLGLASTYGIIRNHGGFIEVRSQVGQGATFDIYLKAIDMPVAEAVNKPETLHKGNETILLVDDDTMIVEVGLAMLRSLGYDVLTADGGKDAVSVYRKHGGRIDMVIMDMIMPDMGGGQTYDQLKTIDPHIKVLLASGYSIDGQASEILERGCNGFIQKPFDLQALSEKVRSILGASQ